MGAEKPTNEFERLIELSEFDLDYTSLEDNLKDLTNLAARIAGTEVSIVNLIDNYTQWSVADYGINIQQMPREESVCQYTILEDDHLEIEDLSQDDRFKTKPYVREDPKLRYYYGIPLKTSQGMNIGTLCVLDPEEKKISPEDEELLKMVARQVVRRLEALKKIHDLEKKVKKLNDSKREVSHDIRNPVSGIIGIADLIEEEAKSEDINEIIDLANMIKEGGNTLLDLVDDILDQYSDGDLKGNNNAPEINCSEFCNKLRELYGPQARSKDITLDIQNESKIEEVQLSRNRLLQILGNLISNSIKFTESGGRVEVDLEVGQGRDKKYLEVEVHDTGIGMDEDKIDEILSGPAESEGGTEGEAGYGMGLSLVQYLVKQAEGKLEIESKKGEGTTFKILIPV